MTGANDRVKVPTNQHSLLSSPPLPAFQIILPQRSDVPHGVESRSIVKVGPFCRKGLSP